jgi:hypothetical protein
MLGILFGRFNVEKGREHANQRAAGAALEVDSSAHKCGEGALASRTERRIRRDSMGLKQIEEISRRGGQAVAHDVGISSGHYDKIALG